ncbi:MAG: hypothetical protein KC588_10895 [Nitrospira sp.]|nr:hypothetical protein [Nitrospira sp.]
MWAVNMARHFVDLGAMVIGIDIRTYLLNAVLALDRFCTNQQVISKP